jgi:Uma2 family endonuclease
MKTHIEPLLTVSDLEAMPQDENRYELIEGEIFMSRAPSITHQRILRNLMERILLYLSQNRIGEVLPGPGVIFDEYNATIPDLVFISNRRREQILSGERLVGAPELIVEILSPGVENERRDRNVKRWLYGKHGVKEYWVIDPQNQYVEIYKEYQGGLSLHTTLGDDLEIMTPVLPGFLCKVSDLFAS